MILCCPQGVISGVMRATGRQAINALVNFCCYYLLGLPLGIVLALVVGLKVKGMWIGLTVADGIQVCGMMGLSHNHAVGPAQVLHGYCTYCRDMGPL